MARPPSKLRQFQIDNDLTDAGLADLLSTRLEEEITAEQVKDSRTRGKRQDAWLKAVGIAPRPRSGSTAARAAEEQGEYRDGDDGAPEPSLDAPRAKVEATVVPDELDWRDAREMIISMYVMIGQGVAMIRRTPEVAKVFAQGAPVLADDWIRLAKVDARTRGVIAKMMVVGPGGQLAMDHVILVGKIVSMGKPNAVTVASVPRPEEFVPFMADEHPAADAQAA